MRPDKEGNGAAGDPLFRKLVAVSTGLAFGGMLASLAVFERGEAAGKLVLRWHWAAIPLTVFGLLLGLRFWQILWQTQATDSPEARLRLRRFITFLAVVAVSSFIYPLRYVQSGRRSEVLTGLALAVCALGGMGFLIWKTIRWVNANEPVDGEVEPEDKH
jgi:hypothetical protein